MRWVVTMALVAMTSTARADRVFVPSVEAGLAVGGSTQPDAPMDDARYTGVSLAWENRSHEGFSLAPDVGALGVWHGVTTPMGLVGLRLDADLASSTTLSLGARGGTANDIGGMHPAGDASIALH